MATVDEGQIAPTQAQGQMDQHLDQLAGEMAKLQPELIQQILQTLKGPAPTAPTPPQFQGLTGVQAAGAVLNPHLAPAIIQQAQGPAQAQFQAQQAAFEQAMAGRDKALSAGASILGSQNRADASMYGADRRFATSEANRDLREWRPFLLNTTLEDGTPVQIPSRQNRITGKVEVAGDPLPSKQGYSYQYDEKGNLIQLPSSGPPLPPGGKGIGTGKMPTPAERGQTGTQFELLRQIDEFSGLATNYATEGGQGYAGAAGQEFLRGLGSTGQSLSEAYGNPQLEELAAYKAKMSKTIAAMREPGKLTDQDVKWAEGELSTISALRTPQGAELVLRKLRNLKTELVARMKRQAMVRPHNFTPEERKELGVGEGANLFMQLYGRPPGEEAP